MTGHTDFDQQVASCAAVRTRLTLVTDSDRHAVVDTCRDLDLDLDPLCLVSAAVAFRTLLTDNTPLAAAFRTDSLCLHHTENRLLRLDHAACAVAAAAGLGLCSLLSSRAVACLAHFTEIELDLLLTAKNSFLEADIDGGADICTAHRTVICSLRVSRAAAEKIAEQVAENITHSGSGEVKSSESAGSAICKCSMPELIILSPLVRIRQNRVSFGCLLEFLGGLLARVYVRMVFLSQLTVCFLEVSIGCVLRNAEHLVIITLLCHILPQLI